MNVLGNFLKGLIIGIGAIAPGVSGGAFAIMLGVYDRITDAIGNFYIDFKKKFIFLAVIGSGATLGIIGFSNVLEYLFTDFELMTKFVIIGLILGSLSSVFKEANKNGFRKVYTIPLIITLCITVMFTVLDKTSVSATSDVTLSFAACVLYGGVIAIGTIVPGISSSIILMYAGVYGAILSAIGSLKLTLLLPLGIGFGITMLLLSKLINYLFEKFYSWTYYAVLGFVLGSVTALLPSAKGFADWLLGSLMLAIGFMCSHWITHRK